MPNEYDKFRATLLEAGWDEDKIENVWQANIGLDRDGLPEQDDDYRYPDPEDWPGGRKLWQREMEAEWCEPLDRLDVVETLEKRETAMVSFTVDLKIIREENVFNKWSRDGLYIPQPRHQWKLCQLASSLDRDDRRRAELQYWKMYMGEVDGWLAKARRGTAYARSIPDHYITGGEFYGPWWRRRQYAWLYDQLHIGKRLTRKMNYDTFKRQYFGMHEFANYRAHPLMGTRGYDPSLNE